ncbi:MAG: phage major capsid protein [Candidatus Hydrogenedentes bacterium]|nr:phage major capsid protein [Candidatus Hydrogenedentota bacterium]
MKLKQLTERRVKAIKDARALLEKAEGEKRAMTAEENTAWDKFMAEAEECRAAIEQEQRQLAAEAELAAAANDPLALRDGAGGQQQATARPEDEARAQAFRRFIIHGRDALNAPELRALQADVDAAGGTLVAPQTFVNTLIKGLDNEVLIRQFATKHTITSSESLGAPSLDADPDDADWTGEITSVTADTSMATGKRVLTPRALSKLIKVSMKLLRLVPSAESLVNDRMTYKFGVTHEKAFLTGSGAGQPLGVFTASGDGISTGRDVSTGNTDTEIRIDGLKEAKYKLKSQYWKNARWMFHQDGVKQIAKLKDGTGAYYWAESVRVGEPDRLLNLPAHISQYAPNTFTTGLYAGILGDFSYYWIVDALNMTIQRLVELYAATNQIGFIGRMESDGMPVLEEAFARVKLA